jgi:hypothetical protein
MAFDTKIMSSSNNYNKPKLPRASSSKRFSTS